jgi:hypothetical protein
MKSTFCGWTGPDRPPGRRADPIFETIVRTKHSGMPNQKSSHRRRSGFNPAGAFTL